MKIKGWGRYPVIEATPIRFDHTFPDIPFIANGNFRSYGDAALADSFLNLKKHNRMISFNETTGLLTCESGVMLSEIIERFLPEGWYLRVTPGTKYITLGGAVAADVHGKNHHVVGCFSESVVGFKLLLPSGKQLYCSRDENVNIFHATCGGMGLTGIILEVTLMLKKVKSRWVKQTTIKTSNLQETFDAFETFKDSQYSVAWIDCLSKGASLGRSLLMIGDFDDDGDLAYKPKSVFNIPFDFPSFLLSRFSVKVFNTLYFHKVLNRKSSQRVEVDQFFHPLDGIGYWNRIYGAYGFVQFQFILPKSMSYLGMREILDRISDKGFASFLSVLKLYGPENKNWLSFPMEGYSLALDFKLQAGLFEFLHDLTEMVCEMGGRIYLAKDALMTEKQFNASYSKIEAFKLLRKDLSLTHVIESKLSIRLGI